MRDSRPVLKDAENPRLVDTGRRRAPPAYRPGDGGRVRRGNDGSRKRWNDILAWHAASSHLFRWLNAQLLSLRWSEHS